MNTVRTVLTPANLDGNDFEISLLTHKVSVRTTVSTTPVAEGDMVLVRQGGVIKQVPVSEFIAAPAAPVVSRLQPVRDFITSAVLAGLTGNDGDAYIVSDGANKSDLALWDVPTSSWIYYSPQDGEYTSILTGSSAGTQWFYQQATDSWIQDTNASANLSAPPSQPTAGNIQLASSSMVSGGVGHLVIVNRKVVGFSRDPTGLAGTGADVEYRLPHVIPWVWHNFTAPFSRSAQYAPEFVDAIRTYNLLLALDSRGKLWAATTNAGYAGLNGMNPPPQSGSLVPIPFFQTMSSKVVQIAVDHSAGWTNLSIAVMDNGEVYGTGNNSNGQLGNGNMTTPTSWVKMLLPTGVLARRAYVSYNVVFPPPVTLVLTTTGDLYGCGGNTSNVLQAGNTASISTPVLIASNVKDFATNAVSLWVVKNDGTLWVRGSNSDGQLGLGNNTSQLGNLVQVPGINDASRVFVYKHWSSWPAAGIITTNGVAKFAGRNKQTMFGNSVGVSNIEVKSFTAPSFGGQGDVIDMIVGAQTIHVLTSTGAVWNCGNLTYRGTGKASGSSAERGTWSQVSLPAPAIGIRSTFHSSSGSDPEGHMALLADGTLYNWGGSFSDAYTSADVISPQYIALNHINNGQSPVGAPPSLV